MHNYVHPKKKIRMPMISKEIYEIVNKNAEVIFFKAIKYSIPKQNNKTMTFNFKYLET